MSNSRALVIATAIGTVLQVAMVICGHYSAAIAGMFAVGGMGISLLTGLLYAVLTDERAAKALATGGSVAGGTCALIGILFSFALGDVPAIILLVGTLSSAITGAVGGVAGRVLRRPTASLLSPSASRF